MFLRDVVPTLFFVLTLLFFFTAPKIFPIAYSLVKPFLNEVTRNKVKILGGMSVAPFCNLVSFTTTNIAGPLIYYIYVFAFFCCFFFDGKEGERLQ